MIHSLLVVLLFSLTATSEEPKLLSHEERALAFERQAHETKRFMASWQPWYDKLSEISKAGGDMPLRTNSGKPAGTMRLTTLTQRVLYEPTLTADLNGRPSASFLNPLRTVTDLALQLKKRGIDFLLLPVPPKTAIYPEMVPAPLPESRPLLDWRMREWYAALERGQVEVIDLLPVFIEQRFRPYPQSDPRIATKLETVFLRRDSHWSPHGTAIAAEILGQRIRQYPWFKEALQFMGEATIQETAVYRPGSPEGYMAYPVRIRGEKNPPESDAESPILLVGDSYSFPRYGLADQLLKQLGFRVDLISVAGGTGLFAALKRTERLASKKLVILEFYPAHTWMKWKPISLFEATASANRPR